MKSKLVHPVHLFLVFLLIIPTEFVIAQGHNHSSQACISARAKAEASQDYAESFCKANLNYHPVTAPPDVDPDCPIDSLDMEKESKWRKTIYEPEGTLIRDLIATEKQCQLNCPVDSCHGLSSNGLSMLMDRMGKKQEILLKTYGKDRNKYAAVIRLVISIEKQLVMLGAGNTWALAELGSYINWAYEDALKRLTIEHDYRVNLKILIRLAKESAMLGSDINLEDLMNRYWKAMQFELTIYINAKATTTDGEITGMEYKIQGNSILLLNKQYFFEGNFKQVWEPEKIKYTYLERKIYGGDNTSITCQSPAQYEAPFFFEFYPDCERFLNGNWEIAAEFERFTPLYETMFMSCTLPSDECTADPSYQTVTLPDGTVQIIEKYANGDGKFTNNSNPIEGLLRAALADTLMAAQKRAVGDIKKDQRNFMPPQNMNDTAAYNKWMSEIQKSMDMVREGKNTRFYLTLQNKNPEAANFVFKVPDHLKSEYDGDMDVTISIKIVHKPYAKFR